MKIKKILYFIIYHIQQIQLFLKLHKSNKNSKLNYSPLISILVPIYNTNHSQLREMIQSVLDQSYNNWELILQDDCSTDQSLSSIIKIFLNKDDRIKYFRSSENGGISKTTQIAYQNSIGDYITFLDHDDELNKNALLIIINELQNSNEKIDFIYSDEILKYSYPGVFLFAYKPRPSPEKLIAHNYICHMVAVSRNLLEKMGGYREGYSGSQDHEFSLRAFRNTNYIKHIPYFLYKWRIHQTNFSKTKAEVCKDSSKKAIKEYFNDQLIEVEEIIDGPLHFTYHTKINIKNNYNIKILFDNVVPENTLNVLNIRNNNYKIEFDMITSNLYNLKEINLVGYDYILFLKDNIISFNDNWFEELVQFLELKEIGVVSPIILDNNQNILYSGIILGKGGYFGVSGIGRNLSDLKYWKDNYIIEKNVSAVSRHCFITRAELFNDFLREYKVNTFWDIDYSLFLSSNKRLVINPYSKVISKSSIDVDYNLYTIENIESLKYLYGKYSKSLFTDTIYSPNANLIFREMWPKTFIDDFLWNHKNKNILKLINS